MAVIYDYWDRKNVVFAKYGGRCAYCGQQIELDNFHVDHFIPKRRYKYYTPEDGPRGSDDTDNLMPACVQCNCSKSSLDLDEWRYSIKNKISRLNNYSTEYQIAKKFGLLIELDENIVFHFEALVPF